MWLKMLLRGERLWDDVVPPAAAADAPLPAEPLPEEPLAAKGAQPKKRESKQSMHAREIIMSLCAPEPLGLILYCDSAAACWETLKRFYGPHISRLPRMLEEFASYAPRAGREVLDMATDLDNLQNDIEEVCPEERPTDRMKTAVLVRAAGAVVQAAGDKGWAIMWAIRGRGYEETQEQLVMLEEELKAEGMKAGKARGRNGGGRKRGGGQQ